MEIKKKGLPIHKRRHGQGPDPRSSSRATSSSTCRRARRRRPNIKDGGTIPIQHTAAPVQFGQLLTALQSDTRDDLKVFLHEYSKGLSGKGARGLQPVDQVLGARLQELGAGQRRHARRAAAQRPPARAPAASSGPVAALDADEGALQGLVTNFNITAGGVRLPGPGAVGVGPGAARHCCATAQPALASLNDSLPSLRAFAIDALPGAPLLRPDARRGAAVHPPGPAACVPERAARPGRRAPPPDRPTSSRSTSASVPVLDRGPRALGLHQQRAGPVHHERRSRTSGTRWRARQHEPARSAPRSSARSRASPARAASRTATTSTSTRSAIPAPTGRAAGAAGGRRPAAAAPPGRALRDPGAAEPERPGGPADRQRVSRASAPRSWGVDRRLQGGQAAAGSACAHD